MDPVPEEEAPEEEAPEEEKASEEEGFVVVLLRVVVMEEEDGRESFGVVVASIEGGVLSITHGRTRSVVGV